MSLYCPSCGAVNEEFAEFCASCGESLAKARDRKVKHEKAKQEKTSEGTEEKKLYRSRTDKMVTGLAKYLDLDIDLVRILWLIAFVVSGGIVLVVYLIMAMAIPLEPEVETT